MRAAPVAGILLRQFYLLRSSPTRVIPIVAWVAVDMVLWGFFTKYLSRANPQFNFVNTLLGAILLWDYFGRVSHGMTTAFLEDVWTKNFLNMFAGPLSVSEYVLGLVLSGVLTSFIGLVVMVSLAGGVFGFPLFSYGFTLIPALLVLFLFGITFGILSTSLVLYAGPASEWMIWPIPAVLSPFVAIFYPLSTLPEWMQHVSRLLPPAYVFETLRLVLLEQKTDPRALLIALGLALLYLAAACLIFVKVYRYAIRSGLIARYSAESVS